jgi:hypothetical protein
MDMNLGLGIRLALDDRFSAPSDQAVASMGRLEKGAQSVRSTLNKEMEGMTREFQSNMINLQNFMIAGFSFGQVGNQIDKMGRSIVNSYKDVVSGVLDTGRYFETARASMKSFYKTNEEINAVLQETIKVASETPFEINNLVDSIRSLKAVGSDAFKEYADVNGEMKQLIRYIGDLGAFKPSQGVEGALFAYREALGGNMRSLKMRFEVNPELVIGRKLSTTSIEEFNKDFVEFMSKLAPNMMENLYGTYDQIASEIKDSITKIKWAIADRGVFDSAKKSLISISKALYRFGDNANLKSVGDVFTALWKPVDLLAQGVVKLIDGLAKLSASSPVLGKTILVAIGLTGVLSVLAGSIMKVSGSAIVLIASVTSMMMQLKLASDMGAGTALSFGKVMSATGKFTKMLGAFGLIASGVFLGYKHDVLGVRKESEMFFIRFSADWSNADKIIKGVNGSYTEMAKKLAKVKAMATILSTVLFNKMGFKEFIGGDAFAQLVVNTGMQDFLGKVVQAKYRFDMFFQGFQKGVGVITKVLKSFLETALVPIKALLKVMGVDLSSFTEMFNGGDKKSLAYWEKQVENFEKVGKSIGTIVGLVVSLKAMSTIGRLISAPFRMLAKSADMARLSVQRVNSSVQSSGSKVGNLLTAPFKRVGAVIRNRSNLPSYFNKQGQASGYSQAYLNHINPNADWAKVKSRPNWFRHLFGVQGDSHRFGGVLNLNRDARNLQLGYQRDNRNKSEITRDRDTLEQYRTPIRNKRGKITGYNFDTAGYKEAIKRRLQPYRNATVVGTLKGFNDVESPIPTDFSKYKKQFLSDPAMIQKFGKGRMNNRLFNGKDNNALMSFLRRSDIAGYSLDNDIISKIQSRSISSITGDGSDTVYRDRGDKGDKYIPKSQKLKRLMANVKKNGLMGALSSSLIGDRMYTISQNKLGEFDQRTVGRVGGLIPRLLGTDGKYNPSRVRPTLADRQDRWLEQTRQFRGAVGGVGHKVGGFFGGIGRGVGRVAGGIGRRVSGFAGSVRDTVGGYYNNASNFVGSGINNIRNSKFGVGVGNVSRGFGGFAVDVGRKVGGFAGSVGRFAGSVGRFGLDSMAMLPLMGRGLANSKVGRGVGFLGRGLGKGVGLAGKGVGKGLGLLGRGAVGGLKLGGKALGLGGKLVGGALRSIMPAMMIASLAKTGWSALSNATTKGGQKLTGADGANYNLEQFQEKMKSFDFKAFWEKFKEVGASIFGNVWKIFIQAFDIVKQNYKQVFGEMWQWAKTDGIKALTDTVTWLLGDGVTMLTKGISSLWTYMKEEGFAKLGATFMQWVDWMWTTGLPALWKALGQIGGVLFTIFIDAVKGLGTLANTYFIQPVKTKFDEVMTSIGSSISKFFSGLFDGIINAMPKWLRDFLTGDTTVDNVVNSGNRGRGGGSNALAGSDGEPKKRSVGRGAFEYQGLLDKEWYKTKAEAKVHHKGLWMSKDEHPAIIRRDETVLPPDISRRLKHLLSSNNAGGVRVDKIEINVQANGSSPEEARKLALIIKEELKKLSKTQAVRQRLASPRAI